MDRDQLFALADYIVAHYGDVVTVSRFVYDPENRTYALLLHMPDDTDEAILSREEFDQAYEPELAAWREWIDRHSMTPPPPLPGV